MSEQPKKPENRIAELEIKLAQTQRVAQAFSQQRNELAARALNLEADLAIAQQVNKEQAAKIAELEKSLSGKPANK